MVILFTYGVFNVYLRIKQPAYLFAVLFGFAASTVITSGAIFRTSAPSGYVIGQGDSRGLSWLVRCLSIPLFNMSIVNFHRRRKFIFSLSDEGFIIASENTFMTAESFPVSFLGQSDRRRNRWMSLASSKQNT